MFGMGTGVSPCLWSPTNPGEACRPRPVEVEVLVSRPRSAREHKLRFKRDVHCYVLEQPAGHADRAGVSA